jgi:hypothetical protein
MSNSRTAYQLKAVGCSVNGWAFRVRSKDIFLLREDAEAHIPEFRRRCVDPALLEHAHDDESLSITVTELELH